MEHSEKQKAGMRTYAQKYWYRGTEYTISELARLVGLPAGLLSNRLRFLRWSLDDAVSLPITPRGKRVRIRKEPKHANT